MFNVEEHLFLSSEMINLEGTITLSFNQIGSNN